MSGSSLSGVVSGGKQNYRAIKNIREVKEATSVEAQNMVCSHSHAHRYGFIWSKFFLNGHMLEARNLHVSPHAHICY